MAAHAHLKNEFTEDEKCHNPMSWLKYKFSTLDRLLRHVIGLNVQLNTVIRVEMYIFNDY